MEEVDDESEDTSAKPINESATVEKVQPEVGLAILEILFTRSTLTPSFYSIIILHSFS